MSLLDLYKNAQRTEEKGVSFVNEINRFLFNEQLALARGELNSQDVIRKNAFLLLKLAKRKYRTEKGRVIDRKGFFHPSSIGHCARQTFFKFLSAPENAESDLSIDEIGQSQRIFANGDFFHLRMQVLFVRMGLCTMDDIEVPFESGDEQGTADAIVKLHGKKYVVDFKSANDNSFNKKTLNPVYEQQMAMYQKHFKISRGVFIYENKNNQKLHEIFVDFDKEKRETLERRLDYLRTHINKVIVPDKEGTHIEKVPCMYCDYTGLCWSKKELKRWMEKAKSSKKKVLQSK